uniref:FMRFamide-related neuropeptide n=1 Tax=Parastrongyloides trichosuri TaxID=131310 RepID=A0A0N4ZR38_PARTI
MIKKFVIISLIVIAIIHNTKGIVNYEESNDRGVGMYDLCEVIPTHILCDPDNRFMDIIKDRKDSQKKVVEDNTKQNVIKRKSAYMRFGKRSGSDDDEMLVPESNEIEKRKSAYMRFGKRKSAYMRFGKRSDGEYLNDIETFSPYEKRKSAYMR